MLVDNFGITTPNDILPGHNIGGRRLYNKFIGSTLYYSGAINQELIAPDIDKETAENIVKTPSYFTNFISHIREINKDLDKESKSNNILTDIMEETQKKPTPMDIIKNYTYVIKPENSPVNYCIPEKDELDFLLKKGSKPVVDEVKSEESAQKVAIKMLDKLGGIR